MSTTSARPLPTLAANEPAWDIARLFPNQGHWSEQEYLALNGNHLVEFSDGFVEVLDMPTQLHQDIVAFLFEALLIFVRPGDLGKVMFAPMRVRLGPGKFREPDVLFMQKAHADRRHNLYWDGADLVMEVLSEDDPSRDTETKRNEYAAAGIPEYWIVDPKMREILVLKLAGDHYETHGRFTADQKAQSALLPGFNVDVTAVFEAK